MTLYKGGALAAQPDRNSKEFHAIPSKPVVGMTGNVVRGKETLAAVVLDVAGVLGHFFVYVDLWQGHAARQLGEKTVARISIPWRLFRPLCFGLQSPEVRQLLEVPRV